MTRHVHADMMIEAANDTSIKWQYLYNGEWFNCKDEGLPIWNPDVEYRKKPREFEEGHWYPVVLSQSDEPCSLVPLVLAFSHGVFHREMSCLEKEEFKPDEFKWIGESLGKLKFG